MNKTLPTPDDSESWRTPKPVYFIGGTHVGTFELDAIEGGLFCSLEARRGTLVGYWLSSLCPCQEPRTKTRKIL